MKPLRALFFALLLSSCEDPAAPKDPVWGKQPCASCAMLVSDPRFAAQASLGTGQRVYFDDPGCMAAFLESHSSAGARLWVHDERGAWIDAPGARFAAGQTSPMDYGFSPAEKGGATWSDVERAARARGGER